MKKLFLIGFIFSLFIAVPSAKAVEYDLSIYSGSVSFKPSEFFLGQTIRIYTQVENNGTEDVEGEVIFSQNNTRIGKKSISVKAGGIPEEAWTNWTPTETGSYNISVSIVNDPAYPDTSPDDNVVIRNVFVDIDSDKDGIGNVADPDDDNDGVPDIKDDFPLDPSKTLDTDKDGIDDSVDSDDDNDGIYDFEEMAKSTDPLKRDTDGDGVDDKHDALPLDPKRTELPPPTPTNNSNQNQTQTQNPSTRSNLPTNVEPTPANIQPNTQTSGQIGLVLGMGENFSGATGYGSPTSTLPNNLAFESFSSSISSIYPNNNSLKEAANSAEDAVGASQNGRVEASENATKLTSDPNLEKSTQEDGIRQNEVEGQQSTKKINWLWIVAFATFTTSIFFFFLDYKRKE